MKFLSSERTERRPTEKKTWPNQKKTENLRTWGRLSNMNHHWTTKKYDRLVILDRTVPILATLSMPNDITQSGSFPTCHLTPSNVGLFLQAFQQSLEPDRSRWTKFTSSLEWRQVSSVSLSAMTMSFFKVFELIPNRFWLVPRSNISGRICYESLAIDLVASLGGG